MGGERTHLHSEETSHVRMRQVIRIWEQHFLWWCQRHLVKWAERVSAHRENSQRETHSKITVNIELIWKNKNLAKAINSVKPSSVTSVCQKARSGTSDIIKERLNWSPVTVVGEINLWNYWIRINIASKNFLSLER